ncbi:hypothetical protein DY000_02042413 [Brassica cretica]|uniref:Uncharacterized protein n=1 Tax=Brassica cretica TaxID=69181 RepID=A0ABQ7BL93_BRACR|nr:hypothetical protein DY000_02042413 [Brassica cretica]
MEVKFQRVFGGDFDGQRLEPGAGQEVEVQRGREWEVFGGQRVMEGSRHREEQQDGGPSK